MASMEDFKCMICSLPFAQPDPIRRNTCPFCNRAFGRADGARRHTKSCPVRGDRPLPPDAKRGRKTRSCDACSRIKVSCNAKVPCHRCSSRKLTCTYERLCTDPTHLRGWGQKKDLPQLSDAFAALRFLLNCTNPGMNFVNDVLVAGEPEQDPALSAKWNASFTDGVGHDTIDPRLLFSGFLDPYIGMCLDFNDINHAGCFMEAATALPATPNDGLEARLCLLEADLQQLIDGRSNVSHATAQESLKGFFTCGNFHRLITIFFRRQQLLAKMIHWPTFDPNKVDVGLLLAIALCGLAYSDKLVESPGFGLTTGAIQTVAEKYIFRRLKHCQCRDDAGRALEICQAAYLIVILQISVNDHDTRQRAITRRQPALVVALRRLGIISSKRYSPTSDANWHVFVYRESCIRLAAWVSFTDGLLALFCNAPPTTTMSEMSYELPCRDELWNAACLSSFAAEQSKGEQVSQSLSIKALLEALLDDEWKDTGPHVYQSLSVFHLYAAIGGTYLAFSKISGYDMLITF